MLKQNFYRVLLSTCLVASFFSYAVPESKLNSRTNKNITNYWKQAKAFSFKGTHQVPIQVYAFTKTSHAPAIVIVPGRTEASQNYAELIYDLRSSPYSVYVYDHRGQGLSGRIAPDTEMGHVDDFNDYIADLNILLTTYINPQKKRDVFIFAHSMGANIATLALNAQPDLAKALFMTSPMFKINTGKIPRLAGKALSYLANVIGNDESFALGKKAWSKKEEQFTGNLISNNKKRFSFVIDNYIQNPKLRIAGPSYGWALEAFRSCSWVRKIRDFKTPTFILTSAWDQVVKNDAAAEFCTSMATQCEHYEIAESKHHPLLEGDHIRDVLMYNMLKFYKSHSK